MKNFNDSVVLKRFIFEFLNRFTYLWFIAFVEFDTETLKSLLGRMFILDEVRKVFSESVLPLIIRYRLRR